MAKSILGIVKACIMGLGRKKDELPTFGQLHLSSLQGGGEISHHILIDLLEGKMYNDNYVYLIYNFGN